MLLEYGEELEKIGTELIMMALGTRRDYRIMSEVVVPAASE